MTLFDLLALRMPAIAALGEHAVAGARRDGVAAYYVDPSLGEGIVRELPDGTRELFRRIDGERVVIARHGPRA